MNFEEQVSEVIFGHRDTIRLALAILRWDTGTFTFRDIGVSSSESASRQIEHLVFAGMVEYLGIESRRRTYVRNDHIYWDIFERVPRVLSRVEAGEEWAYEPAKRDTEWWKASIALSATHSNRLTRHESKLFLLWWANDTPIGADFATPKPNGYHEHLMHPNHLPQLARLGMIGPEQGGLDTRWYRLPSPLWRLVDAMRLVLLPETPKITVWDASLDGSLIGYPHNSRKSIGAALKAVFVDRLLAMPRVGPGDLLPVSLAGDELIHITRVKRRPYREHFSFGDPPNRHSFTTNGQPMLFINSTECTYGNVADILSDRFAMPTCSECLRSIVCFDELNDRGGALRTQLALSDEVSVLADLPLEGAGNRQMRQRRAEAAVISEMIAADPEGFRARVEFVLHAQAARAN